MRHCRILKHTGATPSLLFALAGGASTEPAVAAVRGGPGGRTSKNKDFVEAVAEASVRLTEERIRKLSPILRDLESAGKIQIAGCAYDLETGGVRFLP